MAHDEEIRLLRAWTPRVLRGALAASAALLALGLALLGATEPSSYVVRYRELQDGRLSGRHESLVHLVEEIARARPRALLVAGLLVLTLVPIGRVALAAIIFARQRDWLFVAMTTLVLLLLGVGVVLGHVG